MDFENAGLPHAGSAFETAAAAQRSFAGMFSNAPRARELSRKRRRYEIMIRHCFRSFAHKSLPPPLPSRRIAEPRLRNSASNLLPRILRGRGLGTRWGRRDRHCGTKTVSAPWAKDPRLCGDVTSGQRNILAQTKDTRSRIAPQGLFLDAVGQWLNFDPLHLTSRRFPPWRRNRNHQGKRISRNTADSASKHSGNT
jgi:hypothetical protein